jgi:hypothetical protein
MKRTTLLLFSSLLTIVFISCHSKPDRIVGNWTMSDVMTKQTYEKGDMSGYGSRVADTILATTFKGTKLELRQDKTATLLQAGHEPLEYTWKMDDASGKNLELYTKEDKPRTQPGVIFWPAVKTAGDLFYMKDMDNEMAAEVIFTDDSTSFIVYLSRDKKAN